jgi:hypothetical protein
VIACMCRGMDSGIRRFTLRQGRDVVQAWVCRWFQDTLPQGVVQLARLITRLCDKNATVGVLRRAGGHGKDHVSCLTCRREGGRRERVPGGMCALVECRSVGRVKKLEFGEGEVVSLRLNARRKLEAHMSASIRAL